MGGTAALRTYGDLEAGRMQAEAIENAARTNSNQRPFWNHKPLLTIQATWRSGTSSSSGGLQIYEQGIQFIEFRGAWFSLPYESIWEVDNIEGKLFAGDMLMITAGRRSYRLSLSQKENSTELANYIKQKSNIK